MKSLDKAALAIFLNFSLFVNQLAADLPPVSFDSATWVPYEQVGQGDQPGWQLFSGDAEVSAAGEGYNGGKALKIPANPLQESRISREVAWDADEKTAFIDLRVKPAADPVGSLSTIYANGTQIAFQVPDDSATGEIWVYHGDGGDTDPEAMPMQWIKTAGTFNVASGGTNSSSYIRVTLRHDYARNLWDLFIGGKLAAANLSFEGRGANLESLEFYGSSIGDTLIDDLSAQTENMLFPDADKDGISDAWEIANGSNPNVYDREAIKPGTSRSFLDSYMDSLWPANGANGSSGIPSSGGIPPLTIGSEATHQSVGAIKGALSVGGDGSASYSIPIDLPKGTAGMEPKLSLAYSSSAGNGITGVGWNLTGLQRITRGPSSVGKDGSFDPMDFDSSDRFFLDGERLVCIAGSYGAAGSEYRTETDSYARITAIGTGPAYWTIETKAGLKVYLGSGSSDPELSVGAGKLAWCVNRVEDTVGNYYTVEYTRGAATGGNFDFADHRVSAVHYTGNANCSPALEPYCHVYFDYEDRPDTSRSYTKKAAFQMAKRLSKIRVRTGSTPNHTYILNYQSSYQSGRSFLENVTKLVPASDGGEPTLAVPGTTFHYDGITSTEPLWRDPGTRRLPVYGVDLDATSEVNSMVDVTDGNTTIRLAGDVARAYNLPGSGVTLASDTRIRFDFKSTKQVDGAIIGLDADTSYQSAASTALYRIGGTETINMASGLNFSGSTQSYSGSDWVTYDLPIGTLGTGTRNYLVLICADNDISDGVDNAWFRNVKFYRSGTQQAANVDPILFNIETQLPRYADSSGKDLGVRSLDLDSDGLPDLADWRAVDFDRSSTGVLTPETYGNAFRNTGEDFVRDTAIRPSTFLPLSTRSTDGNADDYNEKHHLTAQPIDVDGDGRLDLMGSVNIESTSGYIRNQYAFYTLTYTSNGPAWTEKTEWRLPFLMDNYMVSSEGNGGKRRDEHFQWLDLNSDGYQDLVVHTTSTGRLYNRTTNSLMLGGNAGIAFINKGKNGPGWTRDDSLSLPARLMEDGDDVGRRIVDLDGDGVPELTQSRYSSENLKRRTHFLNPSGSYRWSPPDEDGPDVSNAYDLPSGLVLSSGNDRGVFVMDLNADGLPDVLRSHQETSAGFVSKTWLNHGLRAADPWLAEPEPGNTTEQENSYDFPFPLHYESGAYDSNWRKPYGFEIADINGDGLADVLYSDIENTATSGGDNLAFLNTGNGWKKRTTWGLPEDYRIFKDAGERSDSKRRAKLEDLNGDGFPDLITGLIDYTPKVWFNNCRPEVLTSVVDGFGSELKVEYQRLNDPTPTVGFGVRVYEKYTGTLPYGHTAIIDSRLVVSRYSEPDGKSGRRYRSQRYGDLRYDRINESSLCFGLIEALDELNGQISHTETSREYPFGGSPLLTESKVRVNAEDLRTALPGVTTGLKVLSRETATYGIKPSQSGIGGIINRPIQTGSVKKLWDLTGTLISETSTTQSFDNFGFVTNSTVTSLDGSSIETTNSYDHKVATNWHLGRLSNSTVRKAGGGKDPVTRNSEFKYSPTTGLLVSETIEPGNSLSSKKAYEHDNFGNITDTTVTITDGGATKTRNSSSAYGSKGRFLLSESNQLGHTVSYEYDTSRALLLSTTDIAGKTTRFTYDPFGTLIRTDHPDGTRTGESTGFANNALLPSAVADCLTNPVKYFRAKQSSGAPVAKVYLDAQGHELATETTVLRDATATGSARYSKVYSAVRYDTLGRKVRIYDAFAVGDTPKYTQIAYDLLGRVLSTTHPDGSVDFVSELKTVFLDGQPHTKSTSFSRSEQVLERWENQDGLLVRSSDNSNQTTLFDYDQDHRILNVTVGGTLLLTNTWDKFGNKKSVWEKNSGTSTSEYNGFGEVTSTTNARGDTTSFTYDTLGRPKTVVKPEGTYTTYYDGARGSGLGKPWYTTGPGTYQETISYDELGRPRTTTRTLFGETFASNITYDAVGRTLTDTDAGGFTVVHEYDPKYSVPVQLYIGPGATGAGKTLWKAGTYDAKGHVLSQTVAQDVTTNATYDDETGLLKTLRADHDGEQLQSKNYSWDAMGNLRSRTDLLAGKKEFFNYDTLNRVTHAFVGSANTASHNFEGEPNDFSYSLKGNLLSKPGASLIYNGTGPHAVSSATVKGFQRAYTYDAAGYVRNDGKREYTWTSFGQLLTLEYASAPALQNFAGGQIYAPGQVLTEFKFDAGGNRVRQNKTRTAANGSRKLEETLYLGAYEREIHETQASAGSSPVTTRTVHRHSIGGFAVYTRTETPGEGPVTKLTTLLKDHLGSTDVLYTGTWDGDYFANRTTERQSFDSWGERRNPNTLATYRDSDADPFRSSAQDYDRGYTGHEQLDDSGLIHMNGRIYDPELGRMLSPDPVVQVPEYSQNFNRYSYVMNNPLNMTDPTGFSWISNAFHSMGSWLKENWVTVVVIIVVAIVTWGVGAAFVGAAGTTGTTFATAATATSGASLTATGMATAGSIGGAIGGGLGAALNGGNFGDVLRGAAIGAVQGAITGGMGNGVGQAASAGNYGLAAAHIAGHAVVGGAVNEAMGGKFQDGFLSAAAGAASQLIPFGNGNGVAGTIKAGAVGGTASTLGGEKFSNGAYTAAFQYLVTVGLSSMGNNSQPNNLKGSDKIAYVCANSSYYDDSGGILSQYYAGYSGKGGFAAALYGSKETGYWLAFRGTEFTSIRDWGTDVLQAFGVRTAQYSAAMDMAKSIHDQLGGNVTFVGHSLGGGLASAAAMVTGGKAITFNAAGLNPLIASGGNPSIRAHYIKGDILSFGQDYSFLPNAYGVRIGYNPPGFASPIGWHSLDSFIQRR